MRRAAFIASAAAGAGLAALGWRALDQGVFATGEGPAFEPWRDWDAAPPHDARGIVAGAILAASPHNTQPWRFAIERDRIRVFEDASRSLGALDTGGRERRIGIGCAIENAVTAAAAAGKNAQVTILPDPANPLHRATIDLRDGVVHAATLARADAIGRRHTNRGPYDTARTVPPESLAALQQAAAEAGTMLSWIIQPEARTQIAETIVRATEAIIADRDQSAASAKWYRLASWHDMQHHADGITVDALGSGAGMRALIKLLPPLSTERNDAFWLMATRNVHVATAAAFGCLIAHDPDATRDLLNCGRAWQRIHLEATLRGIALQPLNQIPERIARERALGVEHTFARRLEKIVAGGSRAVMTFRIGIAREPALASPRRPLDAVITAAI